MRQFEPGDMEQVFDMACSLFDEHYRPEVFMYFHQTWPRGQLVVCSPEGRVLGFINGVLCGDGAARVMLLGVNRMMRGLGLGPRLLKEFEARAVMEGCQRITLELRASKQRLLAFYLRNGFVAEAMLPAYYSDGEDGVSMSKPIQLNI